MSDIENQGQPSVAGNRAAPGVTTTETSRSAFPPPAIPTSTPPVTTPARARSKRALVVIPVLILLLAAGAWLLFGRDNGGADDSDGARTSNLWQLPNDPHRFYRNDLDGPVTQVYGAIGSPSRAVALVSLDQQTEARAFDAEGNELWRRETEGNLFPDTIGDDVTIVAPGADGNLYLTRVDGETGDDVWSTFVGPENNGLWAVGDTVYLVDYTDGDTDITAFDAATGNQIAERQLVRYRDELPHLSTQGQLVARDGDELFVVDERLENVTVGFSWEAMGEPSAWGYANGELLAVNGPRLARFGADGEQLATADFDVGGIRAVRGASDSIWVYQAEDASCGAFRFAGDEVEPLWQTSETCGPHEDQKLVRYENANPLLFTVGLNATVIDVVTGETVFTATDSYLAPFSNGFVLTSGRKKTAYAWPGGDKLFTFRNSDGGLVWPLDGGYLVSDSKGGQWDITVYG